MADMTIHSIDMIASHPEVKRGRPVIIGTGIRVQDIAAAYAYRHETAEEIAENYRISAAQVHAALAYYFEHQEEIDARLNEDLEFARKAKEQGLGQRHPPLLR